MADAYIGEIRIFAGDYAPQNWLLCQGQVLPIAENQTLFAVIGTTYGGDGISNFLLPHFGGRLPVGQGQAPGVITGNVIGQAGGSETAQLNISNLPVHAHALSATSKRGITNVPGPNTYLAEVTDVAESPINIYGTTGNSTTPMDSQLAPQTVGLVGGSQAIDVRNPYLTLSFIICVSAGLYPQQQ